jgi:hypothetical protein
MQLIKIKVKSSQAHVTLADFGYPVPVILVFVLLKTKLLSHIFDFGRTR